VKARWLLGVSAVLAWLFGLVLLFNSKAFEAPVGIILTDQLATIAQAQGAILLGLGVINWLSRSIRDDQALRAVLAGNLVVQLASLGVALRALALGLFSSKGAPAVAIHVLLGAAFAWYLFQLRGRGPRGVRRAA
jgi:hypothetical protein